MQNKFNQKLQEQNLYSNLKELYKNIKKVSINLGFLANYCHAYSFKNGVYYFTPFVEQLCESVEDIGEMFYNIIDENERDLKQEEEFLKKIFSNKYLGNIIFEE